MQQNRAHPPDGLIAYITSPPTGQRLYLALDVSSSVGAGIVSGIPGPTPHEASIALAMILINTEMILASS